MKKKKKYFISTICIFLFMIAFFSISSFLCIQIPSYPTTIAENINTEKEIYVIVPGARITKYGLGYALEERLFAAQSIYHNNPNVTIFLSGAYYKKENRHEVDAMLDYLRQYQISIEDIILDYEGNSTIETIANAKQSFTSDTIYICTQEMYIPRTMFLANKFDLKTTAIKCDTGIFKHDYFMACVREYFACSKATLQTLFK